jgi:hypothetical protein
VTELKASDGSWVQTLSGGQYAFNAPEAIADDGAHIWVVNVNGNSVTELIPGITSAGQSDAARPAP